MVAPSYIVDSRRTIAKHGTTGPEIQRINNATYFMRHHCRQKRRGRLYWVTTDHGTDRDLIAKVWSRVTKLQGELGLAKYSVLKLEGLGGLHGHVAFVGNNKLMERLQRSAAFGDKIFVGPAPYPEGYFAKDRTPQAQYRRWHRGGRITGSHKLDGGGDRVRLSRELERDAIEAGVVEQWRHTNAKRKPTRKGYCLRGSGPLARAPRLSGQILLFPELSKPVARLRDFGRGQMPKSVATAVEFKRNQLGLTQSEFAHRAGIQQGTYANAIRGHDPISAWAMNRLRDVLGQC